MPTRAPEFFKGARVVVTQYGGNSFAGELANDEPAVPNSLVGRAGTIIAIYGDKFYRVELDDDPDPDLNAPLCFAHELRLEDE